MERSRKQVMIESKDEYARLSTMMMMTLTFLPVKMKKGGPKDDEN